MLLQKWKNDNNYIGNNREQRTDTKNEAMTKVKKLSNNYCYHKVIRAITIWGIIEMNIEGTKYMLHRK